MNKEFNDLFRGKNEKRVLNELKRFLNFSFEIQILGFEPLKL